MITVSILQMGKLEHKRRKVLPKIRPSKLGTKRAALCLHRQAENPPSYLGVIGIAIPNIGAALKWMEEEKTHCSSSVRTSTSFRASVPLGCIQHSCNSEWSAKRYSTEKTPSLLFVLLWFGVAHRLAWHEQHIETKFSYILQVWHWNSHILGNPCSNSSVKVE